MVQLRTWSMCSFAAGRAAAWSRRSILGFAAVFGDAVGVLGFASGSGGAPTLDVVEFFLCMAV